MTDKPDTSRESIERLASQFTDASLEAITIRALLDKCDAAIARAEKAEAALEVAKIDEIRFFQVIDEAVLEAAHDYGRRIGLETAANWHENQAAQVGTLHPEVHDRSANYIRHEMLNANIPKATASSTRRKL